MNKTKKIKIMALAMKLSFMAVLADLFYIIIRMQEPMRTIDDASFVHAVPEMLESMLLSAVIITAFAAICAYLFTHDGD